MLDAFPVKSAAISLAVGAGDGFVASYDLDKQAKANAAATPPGGPGTVPLLKSWALRYQLGVLGVGVLGELMHWDLEVTEPLILTPATLLAREAALHLAQSRQTTPVAAQGMRAQVHRSAAAHIAHGADMAPGQSTAPVSAAVGIAG